MAQTIKSLLRISMMIRNSRMLNTYTLTKRLIQTTTSRDTRYNKETLISPRSHLVSHKPQEFPNTNSLQTLLKKSNTLEDVYRIIDKNSGQMTSADAMHALEALFNINKRDSSKANTILKREEFLVLCEILKNNIHDLNMPDQIEMLKSLMAFGVPSSSVIVNVVLQMLRRSLNQLDLHQLAFIDFLLTKCDQTPLVTAFKIALPMIFESNVVLKLDRENVSSMAMALAYLSRKSENSDVFAVIIRAMNNCNQPIQPSQAKAILWSLGGLSCSPTGLPDILNNVQTVLADNITILDREDVRKLTCLIRDKVKFHGQHFYHEGFADACASTIISHDWGFTDAVYVLDKLTSINHMQISLLDYIAAKCFEDPTILENCPPGNIATIVAGFSNADYKPIFWDVVHKAVMSERMLNSKILNYPLAKLAVNLLSLDCYCPELLEKVFRSCQDSLPRNTVERGQIWILYQVVKTLYPEYNGPLPNPKIVDFLPTSFREADFPLMAALECALGGPRYVLTNIRTKLGHFIDHVVVMRKGGFPIAINNDVKPSDDDSSTLMMEDVKPPPDGQVILILCLPAHAYSRNSQRMKATWSMKIKSLEALSSYTVIPIQWTMWTVLPESEKIPYLMQAIRLKCDETMSANS